MLTITQHTVTSHVSNYYSHIQIKFINQGFLSQFSTKFHEILHTLFSIQVTTILNIREVSISMSEVRPFDT